MRRVVGSAATCIDVGAYRGDVLAQMLELAPDGTVAAFEPVPENCRHLRRRFQAAHVFELALSDKPSVASFHHASGRPARSSLRRQSYPDPSEVIELLEVRTDTLDDVLAREWGPNFPVDFLKIDVEGAELQMLQGARHTLCRHQPVVVFEHDPRTAARFGASSDDVFDLLADCGLRVSSISNWLADQVDASRSELLLACAEGEIYFVACKPADGSHG
jgi:FkbM family methyltransferase